MIATRDLRAPAVAGRFYPADRLKLTELLHDLLRHVPHEERKVRGAMVPHAGLIYSGACTASVLGRLALPPVIVILAPNHTGAGQPTCAALWGTGAFETPLGAVAIAQPLARRLLERSRLIAEDREAHLGEHAIEVQLPFLQMLSTDTAIVPLILPWDDWPRCRQLAQDLAAVIAGWGEQVLLLASSDMTHYETARTAGQRDRLALAEVARLDGEGLLGVCRANAVTMCGRAPAATVMEAVRLLGGTGGSVLDYRHSGMVTGDDRRVVGYAGVVMD